ncbi:MAG: riboflavin biosynthesis protein RibF [Clostridia bacterium]|nr:riboflavin biosynthesis protein RibF [Clostridia bacterium]
MLDKKKTIIALGYFDSVHIGHQEVIKSAKALADFHNATLTVVSFRGNLKSHTSNSNDKVVYTDFEREILYKNLGVDDVKFLKITPKLLSMKKLAFLNMINKRYNVIGYVCGEDYRFGKDRCGDVDYIKQYAKKHSQIVRFLKVVETDGEKISTSMIKRLLEQGNIEKANQLLGKNYSVTEKVIKDRGVGKTIGFPTANVLIDGEKQKLKSGVYKGNVKTPFGEYKAVINYGPRPTFNLEEVILEAHLIGFDKNLYGKTITVEFEKFLRDVCKFNDLDSLKKQLRKDVMEVKKNG